MDFRNRRPSVHGLGDVLHAAPDRLDLEIRFDQMVRYSEIELIGPSGAVNLAIVVPLTSLVWHLDALWLGESVPVNGECGSVTPLTVGLPSMNCR